MVARNLGFLSLPYEAENENAEGMFGSWDFLREAEFQTIHREGGLLAWKRIGLCK